MLVYSKLETLLKISHQNWREKIVYKSVSRENFSTGSLLTTHTLAYRGKRGSERFPRGRRVFKTVIPSVNAEKRRITLDADDRRRRQQCRNQITRKSTAI